MKNQRSSPRDENDAIATADSGASLTYPAPYNSLRKGGYVIIQDRPCRVVDVKFFKVGKHGHGKAAVVGLDIFTDKRREVVQPSTHTAYVPFVKKQEYILVDMGSIHMSLLDEKGNLKSDIRIPDEPLAQDIRNGMDNNPDANIMITVISSMDEDKVANMKITKD